MPYLLYAYRKPVLQGNQSLESFQTIWTSGLYSHRNKSYRAEARQLYDCICPGTVVLMNSTYQSEMELREEPEFRKQQSLLLPDHHISIKALLSVKKHQYENDRAQSPKNKPNTNFLVSKRHSITKLCFSLLWLHYMQLPISSLLNP